ncbi:hypothetical protein C4588_00220 [Candidatus Parcubacteria bacterium]|nr:MAG: hypothetical protein C4588_00220 [Candidatus Parcubacteria bacterium]
MYFLLKKCVTNSRLLAGDWSKRRRLLREVAVGWRPRRAKPEEAPAPPHGKRSLLWKSTAVFKKSTLHKETILILLKNR